MNFLLVALEKTASIYTSLMNPSNSKFAHSNLVTYIHGNAFSQDVKFVDKDGNLLGLLISQTSPIINDRLKQLQDYLKLEMPSHMVPIDSSLNSGGTFPTMHFDYFTRYGEQVYTFSFTSSTI